MPIVKMPDGALVDMPDNPTPEQLQKLAALSPATPQSRNPLEGAVRTAKVGGSALLKGLLDLPSLIASGSASAQNEKAYGPGSFIQPDAAGSIDPSRPLKDVDNLGVKPQTTGEKYLASTLRGVGGSALGPGGLVKNAMIGAGAGLGSEGSAHAFGDNVLSRLAGGLAGGGAVAIGQALKPNATNLVKTATKGVTDADWAKAKAVEMALDDMGMPHLKSQLLGAGSTLDDVVKDATSNQRVRPSVLAALRDVTGKAGKAFEVWANQHLPIQADERRDFLANLQRIAAEKEAELLKGSNTAYRGSLPPGVASEVYPEDFMRNLRAELTAMAKDPAQLKGSVASQSILTDLLPRLQTKGNGMAKGELNNIIKDLNTLTQKEGWAGLGKTKVGQLLKDYTSNDFGPARVAKAQFMKDNVEPMQQGLAGDIAHGKGGPDANKYTASESTLANVFPADKAQPLAIRKLAEDVGGEQVGLLLREHLTRNFERAAKGLDENVTSPAKFVEAVLGTPAQRKNIESALMESAKSQGQNPLAVKAGFQKLIGAFASYKDLKVASSIDSAALNQEAGKNIGSAVIAPFSRAGRYLHDAVTARTYQQIADMVASKDGLAQLEKIARSQDPAYAQAIVRGMLATSGGNNPPALQPSNTSE